jgi:hypothetical protein
LRIQKIVYWIATLLLSALMLYSATMYITNTEEVQGYFQQLDYPGYLVIPLAVAKIIAIVIVLLRSSKWLTEWAYAGLFFDMVLATLAHYQANDGGMTLSLIGIIMLLISYFFGKVVRY